MVADDAPGVIGLAASPPPKMPCQYFVLSPRTSLESPERPSSAACGDENADRNPLTLRGKTGCSRSGAEGGVHKSQSPASAATPQRRRQQLDRTNSAPAIRPNYTMPCLRPTSPEPGATTTAASSVGGRSPLRDATPPKCRGVARTPSAVSPSRTVDDAASTAYSLPMTPERQDAELDLVGERSVASASVFSEMSQESRLSRLSRRSVVKKHLSSKEMEQLAIEEKRRQVRELIRRNQTSCRKALVAADVASAGRSNNVTRKVTVPREFNLSAPTTPRLREHSADSSHCNASDHGGAASDGEDRVGVRHRSRGSVTGTASGSSTARSWRPQLTVPKAPALHTLRRVSSTESRRRSLSCPEDREGAAEGGGEPRQTENTVTRRKPHSRPATPERRRPETASRPTTPASRPATSRPTTPASRPATPERRRPETASRPTTPASRPATPERRRPETASRPTTPASRPATPEPRRPQTASRPTTPASRPATPERRRPETARGTATASAARTSPRPSAGVSSKGSIPGRSADTTGAPRESGRSAVAAAAHERAHQARLAAQRRKEEQSRANKEKLAVFKQPAAAGAAAGAARPTGESHRTSATSSGAAAKAATAPGASPASRASFGSSARRPCC